MRTQATVGVVLAGEVVGEGTCRQLGGWADGARGMALLAGQARGRGAVGARAAVQHLGEVARGQSAGGPGGRWDGRPTGARAAGSAAGARPARIPAPGRPLRRRLHPLRGAPADVATRWGRGCSLAGSSQRRRATSNMLGRVEAGCGMACMRRDGDGLAAGGCMVLRRAELLALSGAEALPRRSRNGDMSCTSCKRSHGFVHQASLRTACSCARRRTRLGRIACHHRPSAVSASLQVQSAGCARMQHLRHRQARYPGLPRLLVLSLSRYRLTAPRSRLSPSAHLHTSLRIYLRPTAQSAPAS
jgi:hypothetical protein